MSEKVKLSKSSASTVASSPATRNCTQESFTPSTPAGTKSTTRMCRENTTALAMTSKSPVAMPSPPFTLSR